MHLHGNLNSYAPNQKLSDKDLSFLMACMEEAEHGRKKIEKGVLKIVVENNLLILKPILPEQTVLN
jgi:hypothetical protein